MTARPVHWHEGMFLRPHHFQAAQRFAARELTRGTRWNLHHDWGVRQLDLDIDALRNYRFVVRSLRARLRDGTLVALPDDGDLPALDLKPALERGPSVTVYLALPSLHLGRSNISDTRGDGGRYALDSQELEDENTGVNPQLLPVRLLNLQLLLSTQDNAGYEVIPLARVEKSMRADALPQLDEAFIPPVLAADAWPPLQAGILQNVYDRIGKKLELLTEQALSHAIDFDSAAQGERLLFEQLRVLNEGYALLTITAFAEGIHPLLAYLDLARLVGALAVFGEARRVPALPHYNHDDLGGCFHGLKHHLDALLDAFVEPAYKERPFIGVGGYRMQVALEPQWLEPGWQLFIGVDSPLETDECVRLLTKAGGLDMKVGSSDRVEGYFRLGKEGLKLTQTLQRPVALPQRPGLNYFQVSRDPQQEWVYVQSSLSLALRLNETRIAGKIQDQRRLTINRGGGQTTTLQFTLFALPAIT